MANEYNALCFIKTKFCCFELQYSIHIIDFVWLIQFNVKNHVLIRHTKSEPDKFLYIQNS